MGTPLFSSPEILIKNEFSEKSDAWAVGVILHQLCSLKLPFSEKSYRRIIEAIKSKSAGPIPPQYSIELQRIISKLMQKDPQKRASIDDILNMEFVQKLIKESQNNKGNLQKGKSCEFHISQRSLKNDFENCKIYKNSNFMTKDIIEKLENEKNWGSESAIQEMNESMVIEKKNDYSMGNQLKNEDILWLRERMSIAGSVKISAKNMMFNFDPKESPLSSDK
jgi:serine/threonine protein kinase